MKYTVPLAVALTSLTLTGVVYVSMTHNEPALSNTPELTATGAAERDAHLRELQTEVQALQQQLTAAEAALAQRAASAPVPNLPTDTLVKRATPILPLAAQTETERVTEARQQREKIIASLDQHLAIEELDIQWSNQFQSELEAGLKAESFNGTRLSELTCKQSLCRVALTHDNASMQEQFFEHMLELAVMTNTPAYYEQAEQADGSIALTLYIAREGRSLPLPPRETSSTPP